jgi:hypothetical protein
MPRTTTPPPRGAARRRPEVASAWLRRNRPQPKKTSPAKQAVGALAGALPGRRSAPLPPRRRGSRKGGLALLAGAAGLAFKNRDKLSGLVHRDKPAPPPASSGPDASSPSG